MQRDYAGLKSHGHFHLDDVALYTMRTEVLPNMISAASYFNKMATKLFCYYLVYIIHWPKEGSDDLQALIFDLVTESSRKLFESLKELIAYTHTTRIILL